MADGLLGMFLPRVNASAAYYWQRYCLPIACSAGYGQELIRCWCHDSGGGCTNCHWIGCCN